MPDDKGEICRSACRSTSVPIPSPRGVAVTRQDSKVATILWRPPWGRKGATIHAATPWGHGGSAGSRGHRDTSGDFARSRHDLRGIAMPPLRLPQDRDTSMTLRRSIAARSQRDLHGVAEASCAFFSFSFFKIFFLFFILFNI